MQGSGMALLLGTILPVFFVLALGVYAGLRGRVDNRKPDALIAVLMHFALPCSLFLGVANAPPAVLRTQLPLLLALAAVMLLTYGLMFWLARSWWKATIGEAAVQALTVAFANNVAIGLPFLSHIEGASGQLAVMSGIVAGALIVSPLTLVLLECSAQQADGCTDPLGTRVGRAILVSLKRPVILAPALGLLLPLTGHRLPVMLASSLDMIGKATIGLALFLTGLILSAQPFRFSRATAVGVLLKNALQPLLLFALLRPFHLHGVIAQEAFLLSCVPAGFFGTVFGARYQVASAEAGSTLVLSTLLSAGTLPLAVAFAARIS